MLDSYDFSAVKQIGMAGSPAYTADVSSRMPHTAKVYKLQVTFRLLIVMLLLQVLVLKFTTELKIGDEITFTDDAGTVTKIS